MWVAEWNKVVFTDESRIFLQHHDGRIRVWRHRGERMLNSCVMHHHTGPAPGIMLWGSIVYHSRTPLIELLPWPTRSPEISPIENNWSMVAQRLTQTTPPVASPDQLWQRVEAAWSAVPQEHIQSLFESMPRRVAAVISNHGGYSGYRFWQEPHFTEGAKFEQISEFERGRIIGLREAGLSYRAVATRVQRNSSTIMRDSKKWTDEGRTARKFGSGPRNVTSARDERRLEQMAQTDRTASSRQLAAQWSTATRVALCASSIRRRLLQRGPRTRIPLTQNHRRLRLHWANVHRSWRADWQQVVFSDKSRFNLWHHDGRIRVRRYAGERHIPECISERHSGRTPGVGVWGAIAYHGRSQLLRIVGNLNSTRYINEVLQPQAIPFLQGLPGAVFQ
ncbi:transposable element Tcb2 transposase [Trichonephila clavipes]|nr:transposable element Tcb2 transposase [Trichonephila clavipes]